MSNPTYEALADKEWIITNGLGGYASSTVMGANTRRYHGLLVAALNPPASRTVMVSGVEEKIILEGGRREELATHRYPGAIHPNGYQFLESFERRLLPTATYRVGEAALRKRVSMVYRSNTTVIEYENVGAVGYRLHLTPLLVHRDYHALFKEEDYFDYYHLQTAEGKLKIHAHYGAPALYLGFSRATFLEDARWFYQLEYEKEQYRGLDDQEDARSIGTVAAELAPGEKVYLVFSTEGAMLEWDPKGLIDTELQRLQALSPPEFHNTWRGDLLVSADQFLIHRASTNSASLIAGYHWFMDWGRDTMIAMRGLCISAGKKEVSESIIRTFLQYLDGGMLPNRFPDRGEDPEYNTIDATLWLFIVLHEYYERFGDKEFIASVFGALTEIIEAHLRGTRYNIHLTDDGLLFGGEGLAQLTWMDARVGDYVVTPRQGCPVEINALWYNALCIYKSFAELLGDGIAVEAPIDRLKSAFPTFFLNEQGYLNDLVIPPAYIDDTLRPNQLYALSLPYRLLTPDQEAGVLDFVRRELLTPYGLRTLPVGHPDFKSTYGGDQWQRDTAYHQGTVWPFLLVEYVFAHRRVHGAKTDSEIRELLEPLKTHFYERDGLHAISEIFDGENPQAGRGTIQQAWSVSAMLQILELLDHDE